MRHPVAPSLTYTVIVVERMDAPEVIGVHKWFARVTEMNDFELHVVLRAPLSYRNRKKPRIIVPIDHLDLITISASDIFV